MKWIDKKNEYGRNVHTVELTKEENMLSNEQLINLADNHGEDHTKCFHFGGIVEPLEGYTARITVYTD